MSAQPQALALPRIALRPTTRGVQVALGIVWMLDGLFQFKSFMYTHSLITEVFGPAMNGQPSIVGGPMRTFDDFYGRDLTLWNTLAGELQLAIGAGLILGRRLLKPALLISFGWSLAVWWFGEGFGGLTSSTLPSPLMGAPGAVVLYGLIGVMVWPTQRSQGSSPAAAGPLGDGGARAIWSALWLLAAGLWLANVNRAADATHDMIRAMAEASPRWLAHAQDSLAAQTGGHGTAIALVLALASVGVAAGVWTALRVPALALGIVLSLAYWFYGQDLGGPFWAETATDFNAGPLFVLMAVALMPLTGTARAGRAEPAGEATTGLELAATRAR